MPKIYLRKLEEVEENESKTNLISSSTILTSLSGNTDLWETIPDQPKAQRSRPIQPGSITKA